MATETAPLVVHSRWNLEFNYAAGETASYFFRLLAEKKEIWAKRCPNCKRALLPPRSFCERCFVKTADWVKVDPEGQVEAYTIVYEPFEGLPTPPYAIAYVRLNGADTALGNFVRGTDLTDPQQAMKKLHVRAAVRVVFREKPEGRITDFWYELR